MYANKANLDDIITKIIMFVEILLFTIEIITVNFKRKPNDGGIAHIEKIKIFMLNLVLFSFNCEINIIILFFIIKILIISTIIEYINKYNRLAILNSFIDSVIHPLWINDDIIKIFFMLTIEIITTDIYTIEYIKMLVILILFLNFDKTISGIIFCHVIKTDRLIHLNFFDISTIQD